MSMVKDGCKPAKCFKNYKCSLKKTCARAIKRFSSGPWGVASTGNAVCGSYEDRTVELVMERFEESK